MRVILIVLLLIIFAYSIGLVLLNSSTIDVNLLFTQVLSMNLGLLLILTIGLGLLIGLLLAVLLFRVIQNKWEINRLSKENKRLEQELQQAKIAIDRQATAPSLDQPILTTTISPTSSKGIVQTDKKL